MTIQYGTLHAIGVVGEIRQHNAVAGLPETLGSALMGHVRCTGEEVVMVATGQPDQGQGTTRLRIHCFSCEGKGSFSRDFLTELEAVALIIGYHGGHEGHHLAFRINNRDWLIPCDCPKHQLTAIENFYAEV